MVKRSPHLPVFPTSGGIQYQGPDGEPVSRREYLRFEAEKARAELKEAAVGADEEVAARKVSKSTSKTTTADTKATSTSKE
jgi:hypothetical protein